MFPSLLPKTAPFFELLLQQNEMLNRAGEHLTQVLERPEEMDNPHKQVALLEEEADLVCLRITRELSQTFITPIDREDILRINQGQEEAVDNIHTLITRMHIYEFQRVRFPALQLVRTLEGMIKLTRAMLEGLSHKQDSHTTRAFRSLRGECEMLISVGLAELYDSSDTSPHSVMELIKWTQAYDRMEMTVNQVVKLAETIEEAVLKNV